MLTVNRFCYLIKAHYALFSWPEWSYLQKENEKTLRDFIFEDILCQCGGVAEIVTDNGPTFVAAVGYLSKKYSIHHIKSSPYNSQANGIIECKNFNICKSFMKMCNNEHSKWINIVKILITEVVQSPVRKTLSLLYLPDHRSSYETRTVSLQGKVREQLDTHFSLW